MTKVLAMVAAAAICSVAAAQTPMPGQRDVTITAIPGVVAAGSRWQAIWADYATADGINGSPDGHLMPCKRGWRLTA